MRANPIHERPKTIHPAVTYFIAPSRARLSRLDLRYAGRMELARSSEHSGGLLAALNARFAASAGYWPLLLAGSFAYLGMTFGPLLAIRGLYSGDMNENLAWAWRLVMPDVFPGDVRMDYQATFWGWPGPAAIYAVLLRAFDLELAGKLVALALGVALVVLAARIGGRLGEGRAGAAAAVLLLFAMFRPVELNIWAALQGGLPRSFAYPAIWLVLFAALGERGWVWAAGLVGALLFYPSTALILGGCSALYWTSLAFADWSRAKRLLPALAAGGFSCLPIGLLLAQHHLDDARWGAMPTFAQAAQHPFFQPGHLLASIAGPTRFASWWNTHAGFTPALAAATLLLMPLSLAMSRGRPALRRAFILAVCLLVSALVGYAAAYALFFRLYLPDRFMLYGAVPALWLFACVAAIGALSRASSSASALRAGSLAAAAAASVTVLFAAANLWRILPRDGGAGHVGHYRSPIPRSVLARIRALPRDARLAAPPRLAGDIPFLAARSVYLAVDDLHPFHLDFFHASLHRLDRLQAAMFATDWSAVERFAADAKIDAILVDRRSYSPETPDDDWSRAYPAMRVPPLAPGASWALLSAPASRVLASEGDFLLIDARPADQGVK